MMGAIPPGNYTGPSLATIIGNFLKNVAYPFNNFSASYDAGKGTITITSSSSFKIHTDDELQTNTGLWRDHYHENMTLKKNNLQSMNELLRHTIQTPIYLLLKRGF